MPVAGYPSSAFPRISAVARRPSRDRVTPPAHNCPRQLVQTSMSLRSPRLLRLARPRLSKPKPKQCHYHSHSHYHTSPPLTMRLPYVADPPPTSTPEEAAIVKRVQERRAPRPLQPLDLALLHSPPVADGWNSFLGAVRTKTTIADDVRELAISRVAVVNKAWYEWMHHAPLAVKAGVSEDALESVKSDAPVAIAQRPAGLNEKQWAAVVIADEMTRNVEVSDATFEVVKGLFGERETVEIVATVACYNCVSRFLVALNGEQSAPNTPFPFLILSQPVEREKKRQKKNGVVVAVY